MHGVVCEAAYQMLFKEVLQDNQGTAIARAVRRSTCADNLVDVEQSQCAGSERTVLRTTLSMQFRVQVTVP